jgi:hypothetical protein
MANTRILHIFQGDKPAFWGPLETRLAVFNRPFPVTLTQPGRVAAAGNQTPEGGRQRPLASDRLEPLDHERLGKPRTGPFLERGQRHHRIEIMPRIA